MNFSVISKQDARAKFKKAKNKRIMINIIADLTASKVEEVADFLGVKLINEYPWVSEA